MKLILLFVWLLTSNIMTAQESEKKAIQKTIETFFDGFHERDSILIKQTVSENIIVQTIGKNKEGNSVIRNEDFGKFLKSIASIPDTLQFKEKLMSFNIQVDGAMANAWTSYEFWMNNTFHHCGVNSFQLFKDENAWKIIYLIDTRRKEDCQE
jgi:hypothetical protein